MSNMPPQADRSGWEGHVPQQGASRGSEPSLEGVFTPLTPQDPRQISGYLLRARIGEGGMGAVYLSYTPGGRPVALKVARAEFAADPEFRRRFAAEVAIAQQVQGLYTVPVIDCDPHAPQPWLATAYVAAPSLAAVVSQQGALPPETVLVLIAGVAEALQSIHKVGVIHRDLKPGNVILAADGPRVIDFGISRAVEASSAAITQTGVLIGTPAFMAPEQVQRMSLGAAGDVFSLGATAYYALTGALPFGGDAAVFHRIVHEQPDWTRCPIQVHEVLKRCMEKNPAARPTPAALIELCRAASTDERLRAGEGWLPPTVTAVLTRYSTSPPTPSPFPVPSQFPAASPSLPGPEPRPAASSTSPPWPPAPSSPWPPPAGPLPWQTAPSPPWLGTSPSPGRRRRKRSPWFIGGLGAAALVVVIVLLAALNRASNQSTSNSTATGTEKSITESTTQNNLTSPATSGVAQESSRNSSDTLRASNIAGTWDGSYVCSQGETGLRLTINAVGDGTLLEAEFEFYPLARNPSVPSGSFAMRGSYSAGQLILRGDHWINRPPGYLMVDLTAVITSEESRHIDGRVDSLGCLGFSVDKKKQVQ